MLSWQQRRWLVSGEGGRTKYVLLSSDSYGAQAAKGSEDYRPPSLLHAPELTPPYPADSPGEQEAVLRNHIHAYFNSNVDIPEVRQHGKSSLCPDNVGWDNKSGIAHWLRQDGQGRRLGGLATNTPILPPTSPLRCQPVPTSPSRPLQIAQCPPSPPSLSCPLSLPPSLSSQVPASADLPVKAAAERAVAAEVAAFLHGNKDTILRRVIGGALP